MGENFNMEEFGNFLEKYSNLLDNAINFISSAFSIRGETIGRDEILIDDHLYIVDTCYVNDFQVYETSIQVGDMVEITIVEEYKTREEACAGHEKWKNHVVEEEPTFFLDVRQKIINGFVIEG